MFLVKMIKIISLGYHIITSRLVWLIVGTTKEWHRVSSTTLHYHIAVPTFIALHDRQHPTPNVIGHKVADFWLV